MTNPVTSPGDRQISESFSHPLIRLLMEDFHVSPEALGPLEETLASGRGTPAAIRQVLTQHRVLPPDLFQQALARLYNLDFRPHLDDAEMHQDFTRLIPIQYAKKFMLFPVRMDEHLLTLAVENPDAEDAIADVARRFKRRVHQVVSTHGAIMTLINRAYDRALAGSEQAIDEIDAGGDEGAYDWSLEEPAEDLIDARDEEPIKRLLNNLLYRAAKSNASDVHIDATPTEVIVRFRVDGILHQISTLPKAIQRTLINRIKVMSRLDISQRGMPQDGRTLILIAGRKIDIRVSTLPTVHGEKAVMRLLYQDQELFRLPELGLPPVVHATVSRLLRQTGGIILVSGPTGSGKTTTLYAALSEIDRHSNNIMTIEDPVEYKIPGYVQTEVNAKLGLTFAHALRSVLRQDPDVIMVGEMRDHETAMVAIQAALTGHTVFSTVHTNNAPATVTRLVDMGIEPYLVSSTLMAVLAQRLVRKICRSCKAAYPVDTAVLKELGVKEADWAGWESVYRGEGCASCQGTGYRGRVGIFELLEMNEAVKEVLLRTNEANVIRQVALAHGMISMRRCGVNLIKDGITTPDEVLQATQDD
ncbi:MAG: Flp pilus assembly complex ATPase component TadA [Candidatus Lambdaproteobacteria bacterium]|nr:Flp pilus assembly complex ATPase component TadA [Candidatus Lambdaproteobacteria bacterium]